MVKSGIYQIILKEDGRSYIGSAKNIRQRWTNHKLASKRKGSKQIIAHALAKYGIENFEWKILEYCEIFELIEREQFWLDTIQPFCDNNNGFNVRKKADSNLGITRSEQSRKKQSDSMKGRKLSDKHKENLSKSWHNNRGAEYFEMLSENIKGDRNPAKRPEVRKKISKSMKGKTWAHDKERVEKHRQQRLGRKATPEQRKRMSEIQQKNNTRTPEAKEKFYLAQRVLYEVTKPDLSTFQIYSRELKKYCAENNLTYANLISTARNGKTYKKGWKAKRI